MTDPIPSLYQAARGLVQRPGFAAAAVLTVALGIGATTAVFSFVHGVLIEPLPYPEPERLAVVWTRFPAEGIEEFPVSEAEFLDYRRETALFEEMAAVAPASRVLTGEGPADRVRAARVTAELFGLLGAEAALGRVFAPEEDRPGTGDVAVLSDGLWRSRFGADPGVIGRPIDLDGVRFTVTGVMPPDFRFPDPGTAVWVPLGLSPDATYEDRSGHYLIVLGRLRPGADLAAVQAEMDAVTGRWTEAYHHAHPMRVKSLREQLVGEVERPLLLLLGAVALVLLIACANVAGLLLARSEERRRQLAVRAALGASRRQLVAHLLAETAWLAAAGGALGLLAASWGVDLLKALDLGPVPRLAEVAIDGQILAFSLGLTVATALACGLLPGLRASRSDPGTALKEGVGAARGTARHRLRAGLVVGEIALAMALLAGAGLLLKSVWRLQGIDPGLEAEGLLTASLDLPAGRYREPETVAAFYSALQERLAGLPGVGSASLVRSLPLAATPGIERLEVVDREPRPGARALSVVFQFVTPGYFRTVGTPLLGGRDFEPADDASAPRVVIVNEALARTHFAGEEVLGRDVRILAADPHDVPFRVVGVVGDVRESALAVPAQPTVFLPYRQAAFSATWAARNAAMVLRTEVPPLSLADAVREEVWALDGALALSGVRTMEEVLARSIARPRMTGAMLGAFSAMALLLAAVGIYGLLAQLVGMRTREFGVRYALGATSADLLGLVLRQGAALIAAGIALGLLAAALTNRLFAGLLFEVGPADPVSFVLTAAALALAALAACYLPARRASRVKPVAALKAGP